ncbi:hypothetical protein BH10ACI3_BH10ACI3_08810 [soil metagenome]
MKMLIVIVVFAALFFAVETGTSSAQTAVDVTDNFYATLGDLNIRGLPDKAQIEEITPFLAADVISLIKRDLKKQAAFIKKHPDQKPPWIEGDLFSSLFEGRTGYEIGKTRTKSGTREVDVMLSYKDGTNIEKWKDTVVLKKFGGRWFVTNILFKGSWQFKSGSSLLNVLK